MERKDQTGALLDGLTYGYAKVNGRKTSNRLLNVTDAAAASSFADDPEGVSNYTYDAIGNLVSDDKEKISVKWNVYGKVSEVVPQQGSVKPLVQYLYDPAGNRVSKRVTKDGVTTSTHYVRDAQGNPMAVYQQKNNQLTLSEQPLYGSDRLGLYRPDLAIAGRETVTQYGDVYFVRTDITVNGYTGRSYVFDPAASVTLGDGFEVAAGSSGEFSVRTGTENELPRSFARSTGWKSYEIKDHLGNVRVVVGDGKQAEVTSTSIIERALVRGYYNYYPFGMMEPGGVYDAQQEAGAGSYRYGYNGKEMDTDFSNNYDYGFRIYNAGIAKFLSVDPLTRKYPELTPYQFASNSPVWAIDLDGLEAFFIHGTSSNSKRWIENPKTVPTLMKLTNNKWKNIGFNWKAPKTNNEKSRNVAARQLVNYVLAHRIEGEEITLIGHSHGGNVAIQAANMIYEKTGQKVNIITIATPAYNGESDPENPKNSKGINDHKALWNEIDGVSGGFAGEDFYTNSPKTENIKIDVDDYYIGEATSVPNKGGGQPVKIKTYDTIGAHSFDVHHPETIQKAIDEGKASKVSPVVPNKK